MTDMRPVRIMGRLFGLGGSRELAPIMTYAWGGRDTALQWIPFRVLLSGFFIDAFRPGKPVALLPYWRFPNIDLKNTPQNTSLEDPCKVH